MAYTLDELLDALEDEETDRLFEDPDYQAGIAANLDSVIEKVAHQGELLPDPYPAA